MLGRQGECLSSSGRRCAGRTIVVFWEEGTFHVRQATCGSCAASGLLSIIVRFMRRTIIGVAQVQATAGREGVYGTSMMAWRLVT